MYFELGGSEPCTAFFSSDRRGMDGLIFEYLIINGYAEAAQEFQAESSSNHFPSSSAIDKFETATRSRIIKILLAGKISDACIEIKKMNPTFFVNRQDLLLKLYLQEFIELICDRSCTPTSALTFAHIYLKPHLGCQKSVIVNKIETVLSLLAFRHFGTFEETKCKWLIFSPLPNPLAELLQPRRRKELADEVNTAVLNSIGVPDSEPKLSVALKGMDACQKRLLQKREEEKKRNAKGSGSNQGGSSSSFPILVVS